MAIDMCGGADGVKRVEQLVVRRLTLGDHATVIVKKVAARLAARLGNAQVDARVFKLHATQVRKIQGRVTQHHRVGTDGFRRSAHELRQRVAPP